jgi:hypothetical protein
MKKIAFLILISLLQQTQTGKIVIDINKTDQLNLSEIAEKVSVIPLKISVFRNPDAAKVYLINEYIFILQRYQEEGTLCSDFSIFDLAGNIKRTLEVKDPESNELLIITDMQYDDTNKSIFLVFSSGYGICDNTGNLISYHKYNWANGDNYILTPFMFIFKEQLWFEEISRTNKAININLVHTDLNFQKKEIIKNLRSYPPDYKGVLPVLNLSARNNELYVSFKTDNLIYKVNEGALLPVYKFEVKDRSASKPEITPDQKMFGKYIINRYWYNFIEYDFIYNSESNESYNIKYLHNQDMVNISGIKDDKYNTGYFKFNPTNQKDYIYFLKNPTELKGSKLNDPKQSHPILFLVKLK